MDWEKEGVKKTGRTRGQWREQRNLNGVLRGELNLGSLFSLSSACSSSADLIFVSGSTCLSYSLCLFFPLSLGLPVNLPDLNLKRPESAQIVDTSRQSFRWLRMSHYDWLHEKRTFFGHTRRVWTFASQRGFPNAFCHRLQKDTDKW